MTARAFVRNVIKDTVMTGCHLLAPHPARWGLVLMYHSVGSEWGVTQDAFRWQLAEVARSYRIVAVRDLPRLLSRPSQRQLACITFDDGYLDAVEVAAPVLGELGVPATFFVATSFIGRSFSNSFGTQPMMGAHDLAALVDSGHEIGAHTVTHPKLTRITRAEAAQEICKSKDHLEDLLGIAVTSFAYPKGCWDTAVRDMVAGAGFVAACTNAEGHLRRDSDLLAMPRVSVLAGTTRAQFRAKLSRGLMLYEGVRRR